MSPGGDNRISVLAGDRMIPAAWVRGFLLRRGGLAGGGVAVVAEDRYGEPLDRLALRGVHRRVVEPPADVGVSIVVVLYPRRSASRTD
jgi:hypothetical protein